MKNTLSIVITLIITSLLICNYTQYQSRQKLKEELSISANNLKAEQLKTITWKDSVGRYRSKSIETQVSLSNLKRSKDSLSTNIRKLSKEYDIALRKLKAYGEIGMDIKYDTIYRTDTSLYKCHDLSNKNIEQKICISKDSTGNIIKSSVSISPKLDVFWSDEKVTINPPRKFFLWRLFQRKQTLIGVQIVSRNPLVKVTDQKFTKIYK